jgi:hypothetical protein
MAASGWRRSPRLRVDKVHELFSEHESWGWRRVHRHNIPFPPFPNRRPT